MGVHVERPHHGRTLDDLDGAALARREMRLTEPGACVPALTDREYHLVRLAVQQA